ncbi:hypothetical protein KIW84_014113 [Lathyrus oleraceus]|uniref:Uncharacterized protein n=1 Tax=Pisum sativum TaxID=3888 RepID=A0A9D5GYW7_PEA|nr:hypothetical protein KIW84_014113 [Pisum sativum]
MDWIHLIYHKDRCRLQRSIAYWFEVAPVITNGSAIPCRVALGHELAFYAEFTHVGLFNQGAITSNGIIGHHGTCIGGTCKSDTGIHGDFNLNKFEDGVLSSAAVGSV